ncbi:hypothetical protein, partial [Microcoleus sp. LEGE 07076]|uniref:hypothetical protein n=1 Tax=Microcoleus sp. LEGE 07076 TaxID=915322 RepID=UPI001D13D89D
PIPQELSFLVGWAGEPVRSIDEKDFCKRSSIVKCFAIGVSVLFAEVDKSAVGRGELSPRIQTIIFLTKLQK